MWVPATVEGGCVSCHSEILNGKKDDDYPTEQLQRWKNNILSFPVAPNLNGTRRLKEKWVEAFLLHPVDLRPSLKGMMPRLALTKYEAKVLAQFLTVGEKENKRILDRYVKEGDVKKGEVLYEEKECGMCHSFGERSASLLKKKERREMEAIMLAPDLRFTRQRMTRDMVFDWIKNPQAFNPTTKMPRFAMSDGERVDIVHYIFEKEVGNEKTIIPFRRLPLLKRDVFYPEVKRALFRHSCWHCHSTPRWFSGIDGGPGNAGGFGYLGKGIDLSNLPAIRDAKVFAEVDGMPKLVRHLVARHEEIEGRRTSYLGMPLGLEPYSAEKIQMVETWIKQGARDAP